MLGFCGGQTWVYSDQGREHAIDMQRTFVWLMEKQLARCHEYAELPPWLKEVLIGIWLKQSLSCRNQSKSSILMLLHDQHGGREKILAVTDIQDADP